MSKHETSETEVSLPTLIAELVDAGAKAITAYDSEIANELRLVVHTESWTDAGIRDDFGELVNKFTTASVDGESISVDYVADPDPPAKYGKIGVYIPERFSGDSEFEFEATSIDQGVKNITQRMS